MKRKERGFTIIELIIVLALLSIISAITIPSIGMVHRQEATKALDMLLMDISHYGLKAKKNPSHSYSITFEKSDPTYSYANCYKIGDKMNETTDPEFKQSTPTLKKIGFNIMPGKLEDDGTFTPLAPEAIDAKNEMLYNSKGYLMMQINGSNQVISHLSIEITYEGQVVMSQVVSGYTLTPVKK